MVIAPTHRVDSDVLVQRVRDSFTAADDEEAILEMFEALAKDAAWDAFRTLELQFTRSDIQQGLNALKKRYLCIQ